MKSEPCFCIPKENNKYVHFLSLPPATCIGPGGSYLPAFICKHVCWFHWAQRNDPWLFLLLESSKFPTVLFPLWVTICLPVSVFNWGVRGRGQRGQMNTPRTPPPPAYFIAHAYPPHPDCLWPALFAGWGTPQKDTFVGPDGQNHGQEDWQPGPGRKQAPKVQ